MTSNAPTIPEMYAEWLAVRSRPRDGETDEEADAGLSRYQQLQAAIIAAEPETPRDVAIMFIVDTDDGQSYHSDILDARVRDLAGRVEDNGSAQRSLDLLFSRKAEADRLHEEQIKVTDAHIEAGTATDDVWQAQFNACDFIDAIVLEVCAYRPADAFEQDRKARFLLEWTKETEASEDEVKALLTSMLLPTDGRVSA